MISNIYIRYTFLCGLALFASGFVNSSEESSVISGLSVSVKDRIDCIKSTYINLKKEKNYENKKAYFECFPSNFSEFHKVFGYVDNGCEMTFYPLAEGSHKYIFLFDEVSDVVPGDQYYERLISLAVGGSWQGDAVNYLQHIIKSTMEENFLNFEKVLSKRDKEEIKDFWIFYFDGARGVKLDKSLCGSESENEKSCKVLNELSRNVGSEALGTGITPGWKTDCKE